jgi:predicted DNA-binding transcriptional regulator AlpA
MLVDTDDLIGLGQVAEIIGLSNPYGVSVYRKRYEDFPLPVVEQGRCQLWLRREIAEWVRSRS